MKLPLSLLALVLLVLCGTAVADNQSKADALFKQGKKLALEKKWADACDAFEQSFKLDPTIGTMANVGKCYEEWGKIGRAWTAYNKALQMAVDAKDQVRTDKLKVVIEAIDKDVPRMTVKLPKGAPADFVVEMDKQPITTFGEAFVVDPGPKTLEWWIGKGPKKQKVVMVERGGESEVSLDMPTADVGDKPDPNANKRKKRVASPPTPGRKQRIGGIALAGAGVIGIGVSSIMTLSARSKYNDALDMYCNGMKNSCDSTGLTITHDARSTANTATVIFLVGTALVGGGVALYLLAPDGSGGSSKERAPADSDDDDDGEEASRYIVPSVTPNGAGVVFGGTF